MVPPCGIFICPHRSSDVQNDDLVIGREVGGGEIDNMFLAIFRGSLGYFSGLLPSFLGVVTLFFGVVTPFFGGRLATFFISREQRIII